MESSSWDLRDRDFWLNGYREAVANIIRVSYWSLGGVMWIPGLGPKDSFTRAILGIFLETGKKEDFEHIIKVDLKPTPTAEEALGVGITSIKYQMTLAAAKELGLLDQTYNRLKEEHDQLQYYTYELSGNASHLELHRRGIIAPLVGKQLSSKKYLLVVHNLQWPIEPRSLAQDCGLPLLPWTSSVFLILPSSWDDVYRKSKSEGDQAINCINRAEHFFFLIIFALRQSAEHILNTIHQESIEHWHAIAIDCFHYAMAIFAKHSQVAPITSDELIHQWATVLPCLTSTNSSTKCSNMHQLGRVIIEAFQKYSLLQLPFSPASEAHEATNTAAQFLAYHGLIAEGIILDELADNEKKWISFVGDHGCHVSRDWLSPDKSSCTTALVLRGCLQQSPIYSKLNHFLPKLYYLRVLDLSYSTLEYLPSSIGCLQNLRLLSLRGCHDLKTLFISSTTSVTDSTNHTSSPLCTLYQLEILDMNGVPFSHLTQDLILVNCSNLVELPPSIIALSSLTTLEVTGTQIRYFPPKIFEELLKLQSLKLIDNNNLISLSSSRVHEIKLEGHPNLESFSLMGAPRIKCLSLRGCRKLEYVELKNLGALEELDLSGTAIKELPADIPNGTQLKRLLLLGVPSLLRFPWHMLKRLPDVFYLHQCIEGNANHSDEVTQLCVSDARFFYSFGISCVHSVWAERFFQSFYVRITPCSFNNMQLQHEEAMIDNKFRALVQNQSTYKDVHGNCYAGEITIVSPITVPLHPTKRHVEITGMQQPRHGFENLLNVAKSISVTCDTSINVFSYCSKFYDLEECELRWCHEMKQVFGFTYSGMENLRNVHVWNLKNLVWLCSEDNHCAFDSLKHLHLEDCPRLEAMMPDALTLPCLKTLDILFCYSLKKIFYRRPHKECTYQILPNLQRVRLQELPLLQQFNDNDATITAPMWKELHIRGCWSLRRLPQLQDQPEKVKVDGERSWWSKLLWGPPSHNDNYEAKLPPKFASSDERAKVTSYLR
ncbi:unnamed protein product [Alopecurus aequalis]